MTQTTVKQRLAEYLQSINVSISKFETSCGFSRGYYYNLKASPGGEQLGKIKEAYPSLSLDWLITGEGNMSCDTPTEETQQPNNTELLQELNKKNEEIAFLRSIISSLTKPELPHVTNPATDMGIKYFNELMDEMKSLRSEVNNLKKTSMI